MYSNPISQQLNGGGLNLQPVKELMNRFKNASNPEVELQNILANNPNLQTVLNLAKGRGVSLEQIARMMAQQKRVDMNYLLSQLTH